VSVCVVLLFSLSLVSLSLFSVIYKNCILSNYID